MVRSAAIFQREITKMTKSWGTGRQVLAARILWIALILTQAHADWVMAAIVVMLFVTMNIAGLGAFITALRRRASVSCWA